MTPGVAPAARGSNGGGAAPQETQQQQQQQQKSPEEGTESPPAGNSQPQGRSHVPKAFLEANQQGKRYCERSSQAELAKQLGLPPDAELFEIAAAYSRRFPPPQRGAALAGCLSALK